MVHGLFGLLGPSAPRRVITVNSQENVNVTILNQNMAVNLAREPPLSSRIVWRKNAQVSLFLTISVLNCSPFTPSKA